MRFLDWLREKWAAFRRPVGGRSTERLAAESTAFVAADEADPTLDFQFYLSPIIGTGTSRDPWRPAIVELPGLRKATILCPPDNTGAPQNTHALCLVAFTDHTVALADPTLVAYGKDVNTASLVARRLETADLPVYVRDVSRLHTRAERESRRDAALIAALL